MHGADEFSYRNCVILKCETVALVGHHTLRCCCLLRTIFSTPKPLGRMGTRLGRSDFRDRVGVQALVMIG